MSGLGEHRNSSRTDNDGEAPQAHDNGLREAPARFTYDFPAGQVGPDVEGMLHGAGIETDRSYLFLPGNMSARQSVTGSQAVWLTTLFVIVMALFYFDSRTAVIGLSLVFSLFYLAVVGFRAAVLARWRGVPEQNEFRPVLKAKGYVILVALYKEAGQVKALAASLKRLLWFEGRKRICLICEEDDRETIAAIRSLNDQAIELLIVPDGRPRTKPRALNYALQRVSGDYLVLYDAEDRPHPNQLLEAAARFQASTSALACVQAPLTIDNRHKNLLTRFFAVEYDTLFRGILPALSAWKAPIPLGGTSNHFRLSKLREIGGWDSFNVTEDADLGVRIARSRLHCETINFPTYEEAPETIGLWMRQRTRWIKGWLQTLLVHMRSPVATAREMGWMAFLQFQLVLTSVVVSVLVHPLFLIGFLYQISRYLGEGPAGQFDIYLTAISSFNLAAGYLTYGMLAWAVQKSRPRAVDASAILLFPVYWIMISIAGWLALFQLVTRPHYWAKTDHGSGNRNTPVHWNE